MTGPDRPRVRPVVVLRDSPPRVGQAAFVPLSAEELLRRQLVLALQRDTTVHRALGAVVLKLGALVFAVAFGVGLLCGWWWF